MAAHAMQLPRPHTFVVAFGLTSRQKMVALLSRVGSSGEDVLLVTAGAAVAMCDTLQRSISVVIAAAPVLAPRSASAARHASVTCGSACALS